MAVNDDSENAAETKTVACPYCASTDIEMYALFGKQLSTMQYYCKNCHTPFEYVKDDALRDGASFSGKDTHL
jgi:DNA-directed RNA polymerase subunit RPC12/RpoP